MPILPVPFLDKLTLIAQGSIPLMIGIASLGVLIGFHELGHFLFCKLFNVRTPSFSIGFGPQLLSYTIGETKFSLSAIPFGGYVEIAGLEEVGQGDQHHAAAQDARAFRTKPYWQKILILLGGIIFNLILAFAVLVPLLMTELPPIPLIDTFRAPAVIATVAADSPAEHAGLKPGDRILSVADWAIPQDFGGATRTTQYLQELKQGVCAPDNPNLQIPILAERDGAQKRYTIKIEPTQLTGMSFAPQPSRAESFFQAATSALLIMRAWGQGALQAITSLVRHKNAHERISGPVAITKALADSAQAHYLLLLVTICFISVNLALINLLPLPVFDGGQIVWQTIETLAGRSFTAARTAVHTVTALIVLIIMILLSGRDLYTIFK